MLYDVGWYAVLFEHVATQAEFGTKHQQFVFVENGELRREFDFLFRSLFKDSKNYRKIIELLSKKTKGMTRQEIIQECGITDNGKLSEILENLCNCDFIRRYSSFNKRQREAIYQLTDLFSLFHLRYIKDSNGMDERFWTDAIDSPSHRAWCGYALSRFVFIMSNR